MEILSGIHEVPGILWSNIYLIEDKKLALVDAGPAWSPGAVLKYIRSIGRNPDDLDLILATHGHPDHTSGALTLSRTTGARVVAHVRDTMVHSDHEVSFGYMGVFNSLKVPLPFLKRTPVHQTVADGQMLPLLGGIRVIHTPGHTPGSVAYLHEGQGVVFTGDTLFSDGERLSRSVPFPGYQEAQYRGSLEHLASLEFQTLCGGHGTPLISNASDVLRKLLATRPDPPTWKSYLTSVPRRLAQSKRLQGED